MSLRVLVAALGGDLYAGGARASVPAPGHSPADRSVSLLLSGDRVVIHSFGGAAWTEVRDHLVAAGLIDRSGRIIGSPATGRTAQVRAAPDATIRLAAARRLWAEAGPVTPATLSSRHLAGRAIGRNPAGIAALRHHPAAPRSVYRAGGPGQAALVAAVRAPDGGLTAVELTYLTPGGRRDARLRLSRKTVGLVPAGSAVRLDPPGATLLVGEGVMTALSAGERFGLPAWALGSAGNLAVWRAPDGVRRVLIAADPGAAGEAAAARLARRLVVFDKGRSARAATLACGGRWRALTPGEGAGLQPLARLDTETDRAWAADWICDIAVRGGVRAGPGLRETVWTALTALAEAPEDQRTLTVLQALVQDRAVAAALAPFTLDGPYGALLDGLAGPEDESRFDTFELESLMGAPSAVAPVLSALFRRLEAGFDGRPTLLILDEAWLFLDDTAFAARIREWLKTLRKKRVAVIFATQSLDDVAASTIASTLIESCPTQVFLPNPRALEPASAAHYEAFGLSRRQLELIAFAPPKRAYYWRQPRGRRLFDLRLDGAALALCGAGGPEDQSLIDRIESEAEPHDFAKEFLKSKGLSHVDAVFDLHADRAAIR